jgi:hypothetical protein
MVCSGVMKFVKPDRLSLKEHPELNERWVQDRIAEDPSLLGLGDLVLKDKERRQPHAGRLDLLFQDAEEDRRYEVEIQLGRTDESHIIRTIEYWDIERRRYPQYEHCAVIIAEDITSRFLNVISLFNSAIPMIAVQMNAFAVGDQVALVFNTVLNELSRGVEDEEDDEPEERADRSYWEARVGKEILSVLDRLFEILRQCDPKLELQYLKGRINVTKDGEPARFVVFRPKRQFLRLEARLPQSEETDRQLEAAGLDLMPYKWNKYRVRLTKADAAKHEALVTDLMRHAYDGWE